ncbi:hypothetical protein PG996_007598 [Apiospora saccharicola]|uniref:Rhodopsin domain-containing protein n=1 Tax=Apiospora saccharicola TaxID=335842 RepID=A0ABR1VBB8_9PEZI
MLGGAIWGGPGKGQVDDDEGYVLVNVSIAFAVLTSVFLSLRFWAKAFTSQTFGLDDTFLILAYVVNLGMCAIAILMTKVGGVGRHVDYLEKHDPIQLEGWAKCLLAFEMVYFTSMALPKMAIVFLYLRVFNWRGAMRNWAYMIQGLLAATSLSFVLVACFQCRPLAYWWDRKIPGGVCIDTQLFFHAQAIPGIIMDCFIMGLPLSTIWGLQLPTAKRVALALIFAVGSFGIVSSIIRAVTFFSTSAFADRTFASVALVGWSVIETGTYIITNCLASLKPLLNYYSPAWLKKLIHNTVHSVTKYGSSNGTSKSSGTGSRSTARKQPQPQEDEIELTGLPSPATIRDGGKNASRFSVDDAGKGTRAEPWRI